MSLFGPNIEKMKEKKDLKGLIKASEHRNPDIRCAAALVLGEIGGREAAERLIAMLEDVERPVQKAAVQALE